jgi:hypothetical protein
MSTGNISSGAGAFNLFKDRNQVSGNNSFLESNSIIAKASFLLLIIVVFIVALRLGISLVSWLFSLNKSPYLINGMVNAKNMIVIPQDPNDSGSIPILRSDNQNEGIEFTYSVWLYIDDLVYQQGQFRHIFHKGNDNINFTTKPYGMNEPNNAPGLYIAPNSNSLVLVMNTFNKINEEIVIPNIPLNKWVCVQIRVENRNLDIFVNGSISKRMVLNGVPKQNYGDLYVGMNGGFSGYISDLKYFNYAIGTSEIQNIVSKGPNLKMIGDDMTKSKPKYLSLRWYFMGNRDMYNP